MGFLFGILLTSPPTPKKKNKQIIKKLTKNWVLLLFSFFSFFYWRLENLGGGGRLVRLWTNQCRIEIILNPSVCKNMVHYTTKLYMMSWEPPPNVYNYYFVRTQENARNEWALRAARWWCSNMTSYTECYPLPMNIIPRVGKILQQLTRLCTRICSIISKRSLDNIVSIKNIYLSLKTN